MPSGSSPSAYADQTVVDHRQLVAAAENGVIAAQFE